MRGRTLLLARFIILGLYFLYGADLVHAQVTGSFLCHPIERRPQEIVLDCAPGYATPHDRVTVYGDLPADWDPGMSPVILLPNIERGALVFDANADGTANLVIVLSSTSDGAVVAEVYDDRDGDGMVSTQVSSGISIKVLEPGPVVKLTAPDGWWTQNGVTNFNLDLEIDGPINATFYNYALFSDLMRLDGRPEVYIHVRDPNRNGRPDYEWRQIYLPLSEQDGYNRTQVMVNTEDDEKPIVGAMLWPYLGDAMTDLNSFTKPYYYSSPPPIDVDWATSKVTHVNEFVSSRTGNSNFFIYSNARLFENKLSVADFENPFAFYDLSAGRETLPTLMIRNAYYPPRDTYLRGILDEGLNPYALNDISYVWRHPSEDAQQISAPIWDFKIDLVGTHEYTSVVDIGSLSVVTAQYEQFPYWVTDQMWDMAAFVADEGAREQNSEGISQWGALLEQLSPESYQHLSGEIDILPTDDLKEVAPGYRGEVAPVFKAQPQVYLSSVDYKLHLLFAEAGTWNVNDILEIRVANLDGDAYIDQWMSIARPATSGSLTRTAQLNVAPTHLLYTGDGEVVVKQTRVEPSLFETLPPRNHAEWVELGDKLTENQRDFAPDDLRAMMEQYAGPETHITGAQLLDYRPTAGDGFRFVLDIQHDYGIRGDDLLGLTGLDAGQYAVSFSSGEFLIEPLTPPDLALALGTSEDITASELQRLTVQLSNAGLQDAKDLTLVATAQHGDEIKEIARLTVDALAQEITRLALNWQPTASGEWMLTYRLEMAGGQVLAEAQQPVTVRSQQASGLLDDVWLTSSSGWRLPAALLLALLAFCSGGAVYLRWQRQTMEGRA